MREASLGELARGAALVAVLAAHALGQHDREARVETLDLEADVPVTVAHEVAGDGHLFVWAAGRGVAPRLAVTDEQGATLAEADSEPRAASVRLEVEAGQHLDVTVTAGRAGTVELHVFDAPTSAEVRAAGERIHAELKAVEALDRDRRDEALRRLRAALDELTAQPGGERSLVVTQALWFLGYLAYRHQAPELCLEANRAVEAFRRQALPDDHPDLTAVRNNLGVILGQLGRFDEAARLHEEILAIRRRLLEPDDPLLLASHQSLGVALLELGEVEAAHEHNLAVYTSRLGRLPDDHPDLQDARLNLSLSMHRLGRLHEARALCESALEALLAHLPDDAEPLQRARLNLSVVLRELGDHDSAVALLEQAHAVRTRTLPPGHLGRLKTGIALAAARNDAGDPSGARALQAELLASAADAFPPDLPDLVLLRRNHAAALEADGDLAGARARLEELLAADSRSADETDRALLEMQLAGVLSRLGERDEALAIHRDAHELLSETLPADDPRALQALNNLLFSEARAGNRARAEELGRRYVAVLEETLRSAALTLPPRRAEALARGLEPNVSNLVSATAPGGLLDGALADETFALVERVRGVGLVGARLLAATAEDAEVAELRAEVQRASTEVVRLAGRPDLVDAVRRKELAQERLLAALADRSDGAALLAAPTAGRLAAALPEGAAAVAFRESRRRPAEGEDGASTPWVTAWVVRRDAPLARVELAAAGDLDAAVDRWRTALGVGATPRGRSLGQARTRGPDEERHAGEALRALALDPLDKALGDARTLILALDGSLHGVPLDALPADGKLVGDDRHIQVVSSLAELLPAPSAPRGEGLVALGGIDYDGGYDGGPADGPREGGVPVALVRGADGTATFPPLAGTRAEVQGVAELHAQAFGEAVDRAVLEGDGATRAALFARAPGAAFVHLATHGYFAAEELPSHGATRGGANASGSSGSWGASGARVAGLSPMVLCGLALAGANRPPDELGRIHGVVTAEELAALDLSGCELAVLSACDSALGVRRTGQGIASFQRALHMAGARSVITSLWKVDDDATRALMIAFYRRLWEQGATKAEALRAAKAELRDRRDAEGHRLHTTRDWAGWVLTGAAD